MKKATVRGALAFFTASIISWAVLSGRWLMIAASLSVLSVFWHRPIKYEIPQHFHGWVLLTFEKPSCKPFDSDGIFLVIRTDSAGRACTSDPNPDGWRFTRYAYIDKDGRLTTITSEILAGSTFDRQDQHPYPGEVFFVGSQEQLKGAWSDRPIEAVGSNREGTRRINL
jgi:hypothetical protein